MTRFELLAGAGVLAGVFTIVALASGVERRDSERSEAEAAAKVILAAAESWRQEQRLAGCPTLSQLVEDRALERTADTGDSWGNRFRIRCDDGLSVESAGQDQISRTDDDLILRADSK